MRILVVDDEADVCKTIALMLTRLGYTCETASSGTEALRMFGDQPFDVILTDLGMPGMNGLTVLAKLKGDPQTSGIPVVIVSVQGETDMLLECQRAGAVDHVIKPFDIEDLRRVIQRQLPD